MELPILKFPKQILVDVDYLLGPIKSTIQGLGITSCSFVCSLWIVSGKQTQLHNEFKNNPKPSLGGLLFSENQTKWEWIWEDWGFLHSFLRWGIPSRHPRSSAKAQAEIPLPCETGVPQSRYTPGHLLTNLTWVCAAACRGFCGHLRGHLLPSCLSLTARLRPHLLSSDSHHMLMLTALPPLPWQQAFPSYPEILDPKGTEISLCCAVQEEEGCEQVS